MHADGAGRRDDQYELSGGVYEWEWEEWVLYCADGAESVAAVEEERRGQYIERMKAWCYDIGCETVIWFRLGFIYLSAF